MVDFLRSYHAILGRPCYAKFMAIPNYTYLKLKMQGPNAVITVSSAFSHAFTCDHEHFKLATAVINSSELPQLGESSTPAVPDCNKPNSSMAFCPLEETKVVVPHRPNQNGVDWDPAPGKIGMRARLFPRRQS